ncbi:hypothetical protein JMJ56_27485 [Belnapia sp. T18]|uniref:Uncharacterized protein n=1 Tax=Belnapia arida TaxID=2804533 RepID=A0ABS1UCQ1_9PROT|nr:hypothetical protein [Belnapia arida]MBL6081729.1 hypothetical protein [Belnapia arida]
MPRIPREEHATIVRRVDLEGRKVAEVAAAYGCTPANIYAILTKARRQAARETSVAAAPQDHAKVEAEADPSPPAAPDAPADLFDALPPAPIDPVPPPPPASTALGLRPAEPSAPPPTAPRVPDPQGPRPRPPAPSRTGAAAKPAAPASPPRMSKTGYALLMRTSDGEEAVHPFRSLDELLSAAKPILRTAARSPEPVWFSIQQVDLDALGDDT